MDLRIAIPDEHISADILDAGEEVVTRVNESLLKAGKAPTFGELIRSGARWKPEPPGAERFDHAATIFGRGWGDCDDWAPSRAATLRTSGEDKGAFARTYKSGPGRWHAIVQRSDGRLEDPSVTAGMRPNGKGIPPAVVGMLFRPKKALVSGAGLHYDLRPSMAMRPNEGQWQARCDVPLSHTDMAVAAMRSARTAQQALVGAIAGAVMVGEACGMFDEDHLDRLATIHDLISGVDPREVARCMGPDLVIGALPFVGSVAHACGFDFFKDIIKPIAPIVSKAVQFVPGVGPMASTALDVAAKLIPSEKIVAQSPVAQKLAQALAPQRGPSVVRSTVVQPPPSPPNTSKQPPLIQTLPKGAPYYLAVPGGPVIMRF